MSQSRHRFALMCLVVPPLMYGCSSSNVELLPTYQVSGKVTHEAKPLSNAIVTFHPDAKGLVEGNPSAITDNEGRYELSTFEQGDGAPQGKYKVTIYWPESVPPGGLKGGADFPPDKFNGKYGESKSDLIATISGDTTDMNFELP